MEYVPSSVDVLDAMKDLGGGPLKAVDLCRELVRRGVETAPAQLAIQRAIDSRHIEIGSDWRLTMSAVNPAYCGEGKDRFGRRLTQPGGNDDR